MFYFSFSIIHLKIMIGYLKGTVILAEKDFLVVNVNGVGYKVYVARTEGMLGIDAELWITTFIKEKEETIVLFGFSTRLDQQVFEILCEANGLGPKTSMKFLSFMSGTEIANAIITENEQLLSAIPGVSVKKAQKYILELKDKFTALPVEVNLSTGGIPGYKIEAVEALIALGYNRSLSQKAVDQVCDNKDLKDVSKIIGKALALLSNKI